MGPPHILHADDDPAIRAAVGEVLRVLGFRVTAVSDGAAVLAVTRTDPPNLLILDLNMPLLDGLAVLDALQADPRSRAVPVVFFAAAPKDILPRPGVAAVLGKPVRVDVLVATVRAVLRSRAAF